MEVVATAICKQNGSSTIGFVFTAIHCTDVRFETISKDSSSKSNRIFSHNTKTTPSAEANSICRIACLVGSSKLPATLKRFFCFLMCMT
ncbi:unnamed protein product [Haemonchus placei]|uniref:Uncharacterized protein n=1 Tax=Haemonchus placei TaxID=6290 RepID=A0A3P7Y443_HAEPC|nr:unnamed protein product [Haemonchus placei]